MNYVNKLKKYTNKMKNVNDLDKFITYDYKLQHYQSMAGGGLSELLDSLVSKTTELNTKHNEHKTNFADIIIAIIKLQSDKTACTTQLTSITIELNKEKSNLTQAKKELKENEQKITELQLDITNATEEKKQLVSDLARATADCAASGTTVNQKQQELQNLITENKNKLLEITNENKDLKQTLSKQKPLYDAAVNNLANANALNSQNKLLLDSLSEEKKTMEQQLALLTSELGTTNTKCAESQKTINDLTTQIADLTKDYNTIKGKENNLSQYMDAVDAYAKSDKSNIEQLRNVLGIDNSASAASLSSSSSSSSSSSAEKEEKK